MALIPGVPKLFSPSFGAVRSTIGGILNEFVFDLLTSELDYGIYSRETGQKIPVDVVLSIEHDAQSHTPIYPVRDGSFVTYNKVTVPRTFNVTVSKEITSIWSGLFGEMSQQEFMAWLDTEVQDATLYDIHMPEFTAEKYTMTGYRIARRSNDGTSTRIIASLQFTQVDFYYDDLPTKSEDTGSIVDKVKKSIKGAVGGAMEKVSGAVNTASKAVESSISGAIKDIGDFSDTF